MSDITLEDAGDVATLVLNRPDKRNALTDAMLEELFAVLDRVARSKASVLIVTGAGAGFCAGFDLSLANADGDQALWAERQERFGSIVSRLRALPQATIAAVNGAATGAGLGLALACDTRIGSTQARFSSAFIRVGMSSCDVGVSWLLARAIGTTRAFEMMLTGRMVDADEAERIGLVLRQVPGETLLSEADALARLMAENGRTALWMTKRGIWANLEAASLQGALELENRTQMFMLGTGALSTKATELGFAGRTKG